MPRQTLLLSMRSQLPNLLPAAVFLVALIALVGPPAVRSESVEALQSRLDELRQRYTDMHPEVIHLKQAIKAAQSVTRTAQPKSERGSPSAEQEALQELRNRSRGPGQAGQTRGASGLGALAAPHNPFAHPGGLHSQEVLAHARTAVAAGEEPHRSAFAQVLRVAATGLDKRPGAVADLHVPGHYKNREGHRQASKLLSEDARIAFACVIVYQLAPSEFAATAGACARKAVAILDAWATTNRRVSGHDGQLVMTYAGVGLLFAAELLSDYDGWTSIQRRRFRQWVSTEFLRSAGSISHKRNNWGEWGVLGRIAAHHFLDDRRKLQEDIRAIKARIDKSIAPNGSMANEIGRGAHGIWYTYFALAPLTAAAEIAYNATGVDLFSFSGSDGAGIRQAIDYLFLYVRDPSVWPHYRNKGALIMPKGWSWAYNLFEAMDGVYGSAKYHDFVAARRPIMVMKHHFAWAVPTLLRPKR